MPSVLHNGPFLSLRHDDTCGRTNKDSTPSSGASTPFASLQSPGIKKETNGYVNGHGTYTNKRTHTSNDDFLKLDDPQQDVLLLHGPRQKYSLEKAQSIPELQKEGEILIQVLAIGLNPVDWKGADYGFGQPTYPWVNGRDFAGIVVRAPKTGSSRISAGDVVCGPSTDYRDTRKAAYQEYVVTTDYNVARIPSQTTVKSGASIGVAFVAAAMGLGVSLGLDFSSLKDAPSGPNLYNLVREVDYPRISEDVRDECFFNISSSERPRKGDWITIWGASSATGMIALQLAKRAGLRTVCVLDVAKHGNRPYALGADVLVDRYDPKRAIEIIRTVTGNSLRFAIDTTGAETAANLQDCLARETNGNRAHLLGYAGKPKTKLPGIVYHSLPVKLFHEAPLIGESLMSWLEQLFLSQSLELPHVEVAEGGLSGINAALDRLRSGDVSAKRIVVPVGQQGSGGDGRQNGNGAGQPNGGPPTGPGNTNFDYFKVEDEPSGELEYADNLNSNPERVMFAYWVPNVSGGLVISKIPQKTSWDYKSNKRYARMAERVGFEYALTQIRFMAGYGADNQHESVSFSQAILHATERLKVIAALLPGPWNPALAAKQIASIDNYSEGRVCVNVVSGWFRAEFASIGQWWLDHAERYRRSREFIECLKGIWTQEKFTYKGDFYQFHDYPLKPKPLNLPGRPYPEIFQGGNSHDARDNGANVSDYYFMNGNTLEGFQSQIEDVNERAKKAGREGQVKFAVNAFVIVRDTEEEAIRTLQEIQGKADKEAVEGFRQQVQNAGASTGNKTGMWANSKFEDLVQYNDGFKTKLIGTPDQIVERILMLKSLGISIVLCAFLHYETEIQDFGKRILAEVRKREAEGRGKDKDFEIERTGAVYAARNNEAGATKA